MSITARRRAMGFVSGLPRLGLERCLNRVHRGADCRTCQAVCPTDAITVSNHGIPRLDDDLCLVCGACTVACPTEAWVTDGSAIRTITRTTESLIERELLVVCPVNATAAASSRTAVVEFGQCLAALDTATVIALAQDGKRGVSLDTGACDSCELGSLTAQIECVVGEATHLLEAAGMEPRITASPSIRHGEPEGGKAPIRGMHLTRRGLLGLPRSTWSDAGHDLERPPDRPLSTRAGSPSEVPPSRRRLLSRMARWVFATDTEISTADSSFGAVAVDTDRCSMCGLCAQFCPTGAIGLDGSDPGRATLTVRSSWCVDCGICAVACPENAVWFGSSVPLLQVVNGTREHVASGEMVGCGSCGLPTLLRPTDSGPICFSCREGCGPVTSLRDGAGLMDDLLKRAGCPNRE